MIQTHKIINKVDNVDPNKFFIFSAMQQCHATRQTTSITGTKTLPSLGLFRIQCKLELRNNFFSQCVVEPCSALPAETHRAASVDDFKMKYNHFHAALANTLLLTLYITHMYTYVLLWWIVYIILYLWVLQELNCNQSNIFHLYPRRHLGFCLWPGKNRDCSVDANTLTVITLW